MLLMQAIKCAACVLSQLYSLNAVQYKTVQMALHCPYTEQGASQHVSMPQQDRSLYCFIEDCCMVLQGQAHRIAPGKHPVRLGQGGTHTESTTPNSKPSKTQNGAANAAAMCISTGKQTAQGPAEQAGGTPGRRGGGWGGPREGEMLTYVHGGVGDVHEEHKRAGGDGEGLLPGALVVHVDVDMEGGFHLLPGPLPPRLLREAHVLGKDGHYACPPLCTMHVPSHTLTVHCFYTASWVSCWESKHLFVWLDKQHLFVCMPHKAGCLFRVLARTLCNMYAVAQLRIL